MHGLLFDLPEKCHGRNMRRREVMGTLHLQAGLLSIRNLVNGISASQEVHLANRWNTRPGSSGYECWCGSVMP